MNFRVPVDRRPNKIAVFAQPLGTEPNCLLLDEPAAGLNTQETMALVTLIHAICSLPVTVLLIEHKMEMVMSISDQVIVLNFGEVIVTGLAAEFFHAGKVGCIAVGVIVIAGAAEQKIAGEANRLVLLAAFYVDRP
jgi:ABC-type branched-subunit amino acid transport system ATPase component